METGLSPLAEASPRSLDELFASDPLTWTDSEVTSMAEKYRAERHQFHQQDHAAKTTGAPRARGVRGPKETSPEVKELLSDLDIEV